MEWRANNDNAGKIVTRLSRVQSHKVDLPIKPEDLHHLDKRSSLSRGYVPKFQMMSETNVPGNGHEMHSRINYNKSMALIPS